MALTSIQALIAQWDLEKELNLGQGDLRDLAEKFTDFMLPYLNFYVEWEESTGWTISHNAWDELIKVRDHHAQATGWSYENE